ncbi:hypothetical protein P8452_63450 [Trifolium repens]|nr:hypothetical protein P8452_63450 [Trifolium repens]
MDVSSEYVLKLKHEIEEQCAEVFPAPADREKVKSCLSELGDRSTSLCTYTSKLKLCLYVQLPRKEHSKEDITGGTWHAMEHLMSLQCGTPPKFPCKNCYGW